jgi:hypothetical protein
VTQPTCYRARDSRRARSCACFQRDTVRMGALLPALQAHHDGGHRADGAQLVDGWGGALGNCAHEPGSRSVGAGAGMTCAAVAGAGGRTLLRRPRLGCRGGPRRTWFLQVLCAQAASSSPGQRGVWILRGRGSLSRKPLLQRRNGVGPVTLRRRSRERRSNIVSLRRVGVVSQRGGLLLSYDIIRRGRHV